MDRCELANLALGCSSLTFDLFKFFILLHAVVGSFKGNVRFTCKPLISDAFFVFTV